MAWFKVDDGFWSHPKTLALSNDAIALWLRSGTWSCQQLTDGLIPHHALAMFGIPAAAVGELVDVGYWEPATDGYLFHDWAEYQEASEKVKERRTAARNRMKAVRANNERTKSERSQPVRDVFAESSPNPDPTRPDPTRPTTSNEVVPKTHGAKAAPGGTRLPEPFMVTREMREWAAVKVPGLDVDGATETFVDYWRGRAGAGARKADWPATWRNSLRAAHGRTAVVGRPTKKPKADQILEVIEQGRRMQEAHDRKAIEG